MRSVYYYYYYYETHLRQFVLSGRVATRRIVDSRLRSSVVGQLAGAAVRGRRGRREADDGTGGQEPGAGRREPVPDVLDRQQVGRLKLYVPPDRSHNTSRIINTQHIGTTRLLCEYSVTPSLFHSSLKTFLFCKSFPL